MIEKVARVICQDLWEKGLIDMESPSEAFLTPAKLTAHAAVKAMREPTTEMVKAAHEVLFDGPRILPHLLPTAIWQAMADAALEEEK